MVVRRTDIWAIDSCMLASVWMLLTARENIGLYRVSGPFGSQNSREDIEARLLPHHTRKLCVRRFDLYSITL